ncbi:MAG: hypothetical protein RLY58_1138 [Pseudomonadota bacterium]|jgi:integrase
MFFEVAEKCLARTYEVWKSEKHCKNVRASLDVRINELLESRWIEFDLDQKVWDIPTERMKNGLLHRVPLCALAIDHLQQLRLVHRSDLLFPHRSMPTKPMTSASVLMTIKRAGYGGRMTTHGFRSVFSTAANESRLWHEDVIERQLAHVPKNRIRGAYTGRMHVPFIRYLHKYDENADQG